MQLAKSLFCSHTLISVFRVYFHLYLQNVCPHQAPTLGNTLVPATALIVVGCRWTKSSHLHTVCSIPFLSARVIQVVVHAQDLAYQFRKEQIRFVIASFPMSDQRIPSARARRDEHPGQAVTQVDDSLYLKKSPLWRVHFCFIWRPIQSILFFERLRFVGFSVCLLDGIL